MILEIPLPILACGEETSLFKSNHLFSFTNSASDTSAISLSFFFSDEAATDLFGAISDNFKFKQKCFNEIEPCLLQVGTTENKNLLNLIESLNNIKCKLIIIGKIEKKINLLLKKNNINYINYVDISEEDLIKQYESCDILTFVSTYEGFGMPIVEANTIGRCVITSNCCSMPEIANNAACIVDPHSISSIRAGILKIFNNKEYRDILIQNGLINSKRFSKDYIHNQYKKLYKTIN